MPNRLKRLFQTFFTKKYQFSLAVLLPLFFVLFVFGPMYIAIENIEKLRVGAGRAGPASSDTLHDTVRMLRLVLGVSVIAALAAGIALANSILSPLKRFMEDSKIAVPAERDAGSAGDFAILGRDFSTMMSSLGRYVSILESMSGGVIAFDQDGRVTAMNPSAERILLYSSRELIGRPLSHVCREAVQSPQMERSLLDGLRRGIAYTSEEVRIKRSDDSTIVVGLTTSLLKDADGRSAGVVANFMDLTGLKQMHDDLQQRLRLAGLGRLAAGVAHEVRNPLGAIKGMAQLVQEGLPDSDQRKKYGNIIEQEADRLNRVVEDLLCLVHRPAGRVSCDINALLAQARDLAAHAFKSSRPRILDDRRDVPYVMAERGRLTQAFLNLFLNAFEAVNAGGTVRLTTRFLPADQAITVEIGNTGAPIPAGVKARMFEPFFTTKENGSGLGLAVAHQIVAAHGGALSAESTETETVFKVILPSETEKNART